MNAKIEMGRGGEGFFPSKDLAQSQWVATFSELTYLFVTNLDFPEENNSVLRLPTKTVASLLLSYNYCKTGF